MNRNRWSYTTIISLRNAWENVCSFCRNSSRYYCLIYHKCDILFNVPRMQLEIYSVTGWSLDHSSNKLKIWMDMVWKIAEGGEVEAIMSTVCSRCTVVNILFSRDSKDRPKAKEVVKKPIWITYLGNEEFNSNRFYSVSVEIIEHFLMRIQYSRVQIIFWSIQSSKF